MSYPDGSISLVQIQDSIYDWIKNETTGVIDPGSIVWRDGSKTLPPRPMISLKIIDGPKSVGRNGSIFNAPNKRFTIGVQQVLTLSVQAFGSSAVSRPQAPQLIQDLHSSLLKDSVRDQLRLAGIAIQDVGEPRNLSALEETEYEDRGGFEVIMGVAQNVVDDPSTIETVNALGNIGGTEVPVEITGL